MILTGNNIAARFAGSVPSGKARGGCEKPVRDFNRRRKGSNQDRQKETRTGAYRGELAIFDVHLVPVDGRNLLLA